MQFDLGYPAHQADFSRPGHQGTSLQDFAMRFGSETACLEQVFRTRFTVGDLCRRCGDAARWTPVIERRMLRHRRCRQVIFPYTGTVLGQSRIGAQLWFYLMLHLANSHESVNGYFVQRHLGVSLKASQRMLRRIRLHLAAIDRPAAIGGTGERVHFRIEPVRGAWDPSRRSMNQTNVLFIAAGPAIHFVVVDLCRGHRIHALLQERIDPAAILVTDCYRSWRRANDFGRYLSPSIAFDPEHCSRRVDEVDAITSFLGYFRRAWRLQHQNVNSRNLWLYLAEYRFRYNRRWRSNETFRDMIFSFPDIDPVSETSLIQVYSDLR